MATAKPTTTHSTIRQGSTGPDVALWQSIVGVTVDGKFGPNTDAATRRWQSAHGILSDGIVGAGTWTAALVTLGASVIPAAVPAQPVAPGEIVTAKTPTVPGVAITWNTNPAPSIVLPDVTIAPEAVKLELPAGNVVTFPSVSTTKATPTAADGPTDNSVAVGASLGAALGAGAAWWYARQNAPRSELEFGAVGALVGGLAGMYLAQQRAHGAGGA